MNTATVDTNIHIYARTTDLRTVRFSRRSSSAVPVRVCREMARAGIFRLDVSEAIPDETIGVLRDKFAWDGCMNRRMQGRLSGSNTTTPFRES